MIKNLIQCVKEAKCNHEWKGKGTTEFYNKGSIRPCRRESLYICTKCCASKIIKH